MRRSLGWWLAVVLACQASPSAGPEPTGPIAAVAQNAIAFQKTDPSDRFLEDVLASADFKKAYGDRGDELAAQLRKTRDAVAAARRASGASRGLGLAKPHLPAGEFSTTLFGQTFAFVLDAMTKTSGTRESKPNPYSKTEAGPTMTTTTTLNVTDIFSSSGSKVTYTMHWSYRSVARDNASGATLYDATDDRSIVGTIDVCPDAGGSANASVNTSSRYSSTKDGTRSQTTSSAFAGTVDDSAALRSVKQTFRDESKWQSPSSQGGYDANMSTSYAAAGSGSFLGGMQAGGFTGSFNATGDGTENVNTSSAWSLVLDAYALDPAYQAAQKLWRNGRCVMVTAPDYNAETPLEVADQQKVQHDEEVDTASETKFAASLKHRFGGGGLTAPITVELSGDKSLEPKRLEGSGPLTYKAPDDEDKEATATLKSTSKRGIGTLALKFNTKGAQLRLDMRGTMRMPVVYLTYVWVLSYDRAEFQKRDDGTSRAVVPYRYTGRIEGLPQCEIAFSGSGSITLIAKKEKRGNASVWTVTADPAAGQETQNTTTCAYAVPPLTYGPGEGGWGHHFVQAQGEIVIPAEGGTVQLRRLANWGVPITLEGTATGTVVKR